MTEGKFEQLRDETARRLSKGKGKGKGKSKDKGGKQPTMSQFNVDEDGFSEIDLADDPADVTALESALNEDICSIGGFRMFQDLPGVLPEPPFGILSLHAEWPPKFCFFPMEFQ